MNKVSDILLTPDSFIALHVQLHDQLRRLILSGQWKGGSRIPSEKQLTSYLGVSRSTVRLALQRAELEGLIERSAGRGTFVAYLPQTDHRNRLIAFVTYGFDAESHLLMLKGAESEVKAHGYQIVLSNVQNQREELELLRRLKAEYVSGVLLWANAGASRVQLENPLNYQQIILPLVLMDRGIYDLDRDLVTSENYNGAMSMMQHLLALGHERIVFLCHQEMELLPVMDRYRAYCTAMLEAGLTPQEPWLIGPQGNEFIASMVLRASVDSKSPEIQEIKDLLRNEPERPTAIFAVNDYIALLAMRAIKLLDLHIPGDISVGGFDDIDLAVQLEVPLTTVAQDSFFIGKRAAQLLLERLNGYSGATRCEMIPTQLRVRNSTAPLAMAQSLSPVKRSSEGG